MGLSAYSGRHRKKGELGDFLNLVSSGRIPRGSVLIIESFDRLSREKPWDALNLFSEIINKEIKIVTLENGQEFSKDTLNKNINNLYSTVGEIFRANRESERKSQLLKKAWEGKRIKINDVKLTARAPLWLKLSKDKKEI